MESVYIVVTGSRPVRAQRIPINSIILYGGLNARRNGLVHVFFCFFKIFLTEVNLLWSLILVPIALFLHKSTCLEQPPAYSGLSVLFPRLPVQAVVGVIQAIYHSVGCGSAGTSVGAGVGLWVDRHVAFWYVWIQPYSSTHN